MKINDKINYNDGLNLENKDDFSFLDEINKETLIICNDDSRIKILMRNKLVNVKVMNMEQFISKYCFDYDESTVMFVMDRYNVKYEIALVYIKNLYYIEDKVYDIKKLDFLVELKRVLDENWMLKYNLKFREYLNDIDVIVYGIRLGKYEKNVLKNVDYKYQSTSSNLYPTPQTVLMTHFSEAFSSFSRRRLMCTSTVRESPR